MEWCDEGRLCASLNCLWHHVCVLAEGRGTAWYSGWDGVASRTWHSAVSFNQQGKCASRDGDVKRECGVSD